MKSFRMLFSSKVQVWLHQNMSLYTFLGIQGDLGMKGQKGELGLPGLTGPQGLQGKIIKQKWIILFVR